MRLPSLFIGHGSPMNAIETNTYTNSWFKAGQTLSSTPRAILCISAHWITDKITLTGMTKPKTIHVCILKILKPIIIFTIFFLL